MESKNQIEESNYFISQKPSNINSSQALNFNANGPSPPHEITIN